MKPRIIDNVDSLIMHLAKKDGYIENDKNSLINKSDWDEKEIENIYKGCAKYVEHNMDDGLKYVDDPIQYDYNFFKKVCDECKLNYMEDYNNLENPYSLISEKYILAYIKKYVETAEMELII